MATPQLSRADAKAAADAMAKYSNETKAAASLGLTRGAFQGRLRSAKAYGLAVKKPVTTATPHAPVAEQPLVDQLRDQLYELKAQLKSIKGDSLDTEYVKRKILGIKESADAVQPPTWLLQLERGKSLPGVPVAVWSDWHHGEVVFPDQVNGLNSFNLAISNARIRKLVERTVMLLKRHVVNPKYPGIVINLGGDMLTGDIHDELKESNEVPLLPALLDLLSALQWAVATMANEFGRVFIPCVTGNHGRMSRKPQAKNRNFTNYDWLLYQLLARHFASDDRVQFFIPDGSDALYSVMGHKFLLTHGDQWRGGDGQIGSIGPITRGTMKKQSRNAAINLEFDTLICGHFHQYMPLHRSIVNGSLKGLDEYAYQGNFGFEPPIQALWLNHPQHGITMHMPVYLEDHPGKAGTEPWVQWNAGK